MPDKIGHYTIVSELGRGGMGVVYKGHEESLNRFVAIKVLGDHLTAEPEFLSRFIREARAAAGLSHPNVIQIFFIGEDQGRHYFVMEYVSGSSVQSLIRREGRIGNPRAAQIILQAAHGLAAAHDQGIYHRDIKPANLMLDTRGVLKIADFGLALPTEAQTRLTAAGKIMGTPGYLSPEHCLGQEVDHRADIYALGITYYEMLTGSMPFRGDSPIALLRAILQDDPPDIRQLNPEVDDDSRRILMKMLEKKREDRYQDAHQLVADLEEYLAKRGVRSVTAGLGTRTSAGVANDMPTAVVDAPTQRFADVTTAGPTAKMVLPVATPPPAKPSRTAAYATIAIVVFMMLVGAGVAAFFGYRYYTRPQATPQIAQAAAVTPPNTSTTEQQKLIEPPVTPASPPTGTPASSPAPMTVAASPVRAAEARGAPPRPMQQQQRSLSGVAIAAVGDPGLDTAVEAVLASELADLKPVNAEDLPQDINGMLDALRRNGVATLVVARIKATGQRELSYLGRSDIAYRSNVTLQVYDVESGRPVGERASGTIEYTSLNAEREAETIVGPLARRVAESIPHR